MDSGISAESTPEIHPWVVLTQACLNKTKPSDDGLIRPDKIKRLNVCVGKESIHRAMLIWDRILKAVEASRFKMRMEKEAPCRTIITVDGEDLCISLKEKTTRTEHVLTPADEAAMRRFKHLHGVPTWDYLPSGKLVLSIDYLNVHQQLVNQVKWVDSDKKRIEDRVTAIAEVLQEVANELKEKQVRAEEWKRNWDEEVRRRQETARLQAEEKGRIEQLERQASAWALACSIRRFIDAVREEAKRRGGFEPECPLDQWLHWAEGHAKTIDPVGSVLASAVLRKKGG